MADDRRSVPGAVGERLPSKTADAVGARGWGVAAPERDEDALVAALMRLLEDDAFAANARSNLDAHPLQLCRRAPG